MKQLIQNLKNGETSIVDCPIPKPLDNEILIQSSMSLVSIGTEKMLINFSKDNLFKKAQKNPHRIKQVIDKIKNEGIKQTYSSVKNKLDDPIPLGYCNVGKVIQVGIYITNFSVDDRVVSNGAHAEFVSVPKNLVAKIPDGVSNEEAVFTIIGSIGLQGIRLMKPNFGETIIVIGLGLIGLMTCQLLKANGCNVIGIDIDQNKCDLLNKFGIKSVNSRNENFLQYINDQTNDVGADGVIITASTRSNELISDSSKMCRKKGSIVLVGVVGLNLNREDFYKKEIKFQVSCSYGPGRYDNNYEQLGIDYPLSYVRWTEKRNFEAILFSLDNKIIDVKKLISKKVYFEEYKEIYDDLNNKDAIACILVYPTADIDINSQVKIKIKETCFKDEKAVIGIVGSGNFSKMVLLPVLKKINSNIKYLGSLKGLTCTHLAKKFGISYSTTNYKDILLDDEIDTFIISTRHDSHSKLVIESLKAGKNTFVEKPLAINHNQLDDVIKIYKNCKNPSLMVGFNRRFSIHLQSIKQELLDFKGPINIVANMNAGFIDSDHWVHNLEIGGGRIIGEACHLIDICVFLTGSLVKTVCMNALGNDTSLDTDNASLLLKFNDGSNAIVNYFSNGSKSYSKERLEVYFGSKNLIVDNFIKTEGFGFKKFKTIKTKLDKGHITQFSKYIQNIKSGGEKLISFKEIVNVTRSSISALDSLKNKRWENVSLKI